MARDILNNQFAVPFLLLVAGYLLRVLHTKLSCRTSVLNYSVRVDHVALSAEDPVFGTVRVCWQGRDVRNLCTATIELENGTTRDLESVGLVVYSDMDTVLLSEATRVIDTPDIIWWSDEYKKSIAVPDGSEPTPDQWKIYGSRREYTVPVLNRGQRLEFTYLCTRLSGDNPPSLFLHTPCKGVKLRYQVMQPVIFGVPVNVAVSRGLVISVIVLLLCGAFIGSVWIAATIAMLVGLSTQALGSLAYKAERFMRNLIAG